jgi:hypothetical protein
MINMYKGKWVGSCVTLTYGRREMKASDSMCRRATWRMLIENIKVKSVPRQVVTRVGYFSSSGIIIVFRIIFSSQADLSLQD